MSNAVLALNVLTNVLQAVQAAKPGEIASGVSPAGNKEVVAACWQQLTKSNTLPGVDPLTSARCNALNLANTAMFSASVATTQKQVDALHAAASAYLKIHDSLAGASWYSTAGTVRSLRAESRQIQDNAQLRGLLTKLVETLIEVAAATRR